MTEVAVPAMTPGRLQAIFIEALRARAEPPPIEICAELALELTGLRRADVEWAGGEHLSEKPYAASVALRNALPEAEAFWRAYGGEAAGRAERKIAALRAALDDCADAEGRGNVLGPFPHPHEEKWYDFVELLLRAFDQGMTKAGNKQDITIWIGSPLVIFVHRCLCDLGWSDLPRGVKLLPSAVLQRLHRHHQPSISGGDTDKTVGDIC